MICGFIETYTCTTNVFRRLKQRMSLFPPVWTTSLNVETPLSSDPRNSPPLSFSSHITLDALTSNQRNPACSQPSYNIVSNDAVSVNPNVVNDRPVAFAITTQGSDSHYTICIVVLSPYPSLPSPTSTPARPHFPLHHYGRQHDDQCGLLCYRLSSAG